MATTNAQIHNWIAELVDIKAEIDRLNRRKHAIGKKLGFGTFRSVDIPLIKIVVGKGGSGESISWKAIATQIANEFNVLLNAYKPRHTTYTYRKPSVSVQSERAYAGNNPALKRA